MNFQAEQTVCNQKVNLVPAEQNKCDGRIGELIHLARVLAPCELVQLHAFLLITVHKYKVHLDLSIKLQARKNACKSIKTLFTARRARAKSSSSEDARRNKLYSRALIEWIQGLSSRISLRVMREKEKKKQEEELKQLLAARNYQSWSRPCAIIFIIFCILKIARRHTSADQKSFPRHLNYTEVAKCLARGPWAEWTFWFRCELSRRVKLYLY